jgi:hypothetical protein
MDKVEISLVNMIKYGPRAIPEVYIVYGGNYGKNIGSCKT